MLLCVLLLCSLNNTFCNIEPSFLDIESEKEFSQEIMDQVEKKKKVSFCDQNRGPKGKKIKTKTLWVPLFSLVPCDGSCSSTSSAVIFPEALQGTHCPHSTQEDTEMHAAGSYRARKFA